MKVHAQNLRYQVQCFCHLLFKSYIDSLQLFRQFTKCSIPFITHIQNMTLLTGQTRTENFFFFTLCSSSFWTTRVCYYSLLWSMYFCGSKICGFIRRTVESLFVLQIWLYNFWFFTFSFHTHLLLKVGSLHDVHGTLPQVFNLGRKWKYKDELPS